MLFPRTHFWTRRQKALIVGSVVLALASFGALIYGFERYHRGPTDSVFFGTWEMGYCMDCTNLIAFQPNHDAIGFGDYLGRQDVLDFHGRWYAGGRQLIVRYDDPDEGRLLVMQILEITPDLIRVRWNGGEMHLKRSTRTPPQASNRAMERTANHPYV